MAGAFPGCSQLWAQAVPCNADRTLHYHILDGGHRLDHNLELESHQTEVPLPCKQSLPKFVLATNQELEREIAHLPWNCYNCSSLGVKSPMLAPEAIWCLTCDTDKLATAEAVLTSLSVAIIDTWLDGHCEGASNAGIKTVSGKEIRLMAWSPHNRANSGLLEMAWIDPRGQAAMTEGKRLTQLYPPASCFCNDIHTDSHVF